MKMTGDDELDFLREAGSWALNNQAKAYYKYAVPAELFGLAVIYGIVALMSGTVALWILTILGTLFVLQFLAVTLTQIVARRKLKKHTASQDALNEATRGMWG